MLTPFNYSFYFHSSSDLSNTSLPIDELIVKVEAPEVRKAEEAENAVEAPEVSETGESSGTKLKRKAEEAEDLHGERFDCLHCDKSFTLAHNLTRHITQKHDAAFNQWTCKDSACPYVTANKSDMNRHLKGVHGLLPYLPSSKRDDVEEAPVGGKGKGGKGGKGKKTKK